MSKSNRSEERLQIMSVRVYTVDAFTNTPYSGNPAAVCCLEAPANDQWMQDVASEMNLAETAFVYQENDGYRLRWFTPTVEVDICGHATLASSHILWEQKLASPDKPIRFYTRSGVLTASKIGDRIELDFPADPESTVELTEDLSIVLRESLGAEPMYVGKSQRDFLVEVKNETILKEMVPNMSILAQVPMRGYIVTTKSDRPEFDFISRCFYPAVGIPEDSVTGSAHCCLAIFWAKRLGKSEMNGYQASSRGGTVGVKIIGDRVILMGQAVTILVGELLA